MEGRTEMGISSRRVVIVGAQRTPIGRFGGRLSAVSPAELGTIAATAALRQISVDAVQSVIVGQVLSAGHGMNVARQIAVRAGVPISVPAYTLNMMCGSGLHAIAQSARSIRCGDADVALCGGVESMSQAPLLVKRPRKGQSPDFNASRDSMQTEGLLDAFSGNHMGVTAEQLATDFGISRSEQDIFAERSQHQYAEASRKGVFAEEITAVGDLLHDEHPRPEVTASSLGTLTPIFRKDGTVTAGNSSGINDGAAMVVLADAEYALQRKLPILAEWVSDAAVGCDPQRMGLGPVWAIQQLLQKTGIEWSTVDHVEINEAFAAQTLACVRELAGQGLPVRMSPSDEPTKSCPILNPHGGAIAIGHPLAASGARLICHAAHQIQAGRFENSIVSLCVGGGMGVGALLRRFTG